MKVRLEKLLHKVATTNEVLDAIQNIENDKIAENNRFDGIERLKEKQIAKKNEIKHLEAAADTALAAGDDPFIYINQISNLKKELETIAHFIPAKPSPADDRAEYAKKQALRQELADSLKMAFYNSTFKKEVNQQIQQHLEAVQNLCVQWDDVWAELFRMHNSQSGAVSKVNIKLENTLLGRWVKSNLSDIDYSR